MVYFMMLMQRGPVKRGTYLRVQAVPGEVSAGEPLLKVRVLDCMAHVPHHGVHVTRRQVLDHHAQDGLHELAGALAHDLAHEGLHLRGREEGFDQWQSRRLFLQRTWQWYG